MTGDSRAPTALGRAPTIHDVARLAGVSKSAVSLAIRGQKGLSAATREQILAAAQQLGYRSNVWARSLVRGRTGLIGVLLGDLGNGYHRDIATGIEDAAAEHGLRVVIAHGRRDRDRLERELGSLLALGVEGVVIVSSWLPAQHLEQISTRVPLVVIGRLMAEVPGVDTIANEDEVGARLAVRHLRDLGHTRITHLTGSTRTASMHRRRSFVDAMNAEQLNLEPQVAGPEDLLRAQELLIASIHQDPDAPTAVFAQNDTLAVGLIGMCIDSGLRLPEQLSVVGYDNSSVCDLIRPRLTSVNQPRENMGALALQMLQDRISGRSEARHVAMTPSLVVRSSTAPARS